LTPHHLVLEYFKRLKYDIMPIVLKDIATQLGLSSATVSLALNGSPLVADKTRERVTRLAAKLDYVPNGFGRGLQARKSSLLGCLLTTITSSFFNEILQSTGQEAARNGYGLLTGWVRGPDAQFERQIQLMLEKNVDGLILSVQEEWITPYMEKFTMRNIPVVFCSTYCGKEYSSVITDNFAGGRMAAEYLLEKGHGHLLCAASDALRLAGNRASIAAAGGPEPMTFKHEEEVPALLRAHPQLTAITAYSDLQAIDLMRLLREQGWRIPADISIIGFDNIWLAGRPEYQLTTIGQQRERIGQAAVQGLLEMIQRKETYYKLLLEPELVKRKTVRKMRRA
jgi:DNA-binding LacI/PurR family transcriptional regulator